MLYLKLLIVWFHKNYTSYLTSKSSLCIASSNTVVGFLDSCPWKSSSHSPYDNWIFTLAKASWKATHINCVFSWWCVWHHLRSSKMEGSIETPGCTRLFNILFMDSFKAWSTWSNSYMPMTRLTSEASFSLSLNANIWSNLYTPRFISRKATSFGALHSIIMCFNLGSTSILIWLFKPLCCASQLTPHFATKQGPQPSLVFSFSFL